MFRRFFVIAVSAAFIAALVVPAATADPIRAKNAAQIHALCGGHPVDVVVNGNGEFTAAHVLGSTSVFIPTAFDITFTFTPTVGSPMSETDTSSKAAPIRETTTCTIPLQTVFSGPEGSATIQGTVTGFFTPR
jgi:hypothetical protein